MAESHKVSKSTIANLCKVQGHHLKPHRVKTLQLSRDRKFLQKLTDVVGLYLTSAAAGDRSCKYEKIQIQPLDRAERSLPIRKGRWGWQDDAQLPEQPTTMPRSWRLATSSS
jgi:hypothetical protein